MKKKIRIIPLIGLFSIVIGVVFGFKTLAGFGVGILTYHFAFLEKTKREKQ